MNAQSRSLPVPEGLDGLRLDVAVSRLFGLSRTAAVGLLDTGAVSVDGKDGRKSDRVSTGEWLEVTLLSTGSTGLGASDVFYFGNLGGETGDDPNNAKVNALDLGRTQAHLHETATISSPYDPNHDGRINALDIAAIKVNLNRSIHLIQPVGEDGGPPAATSLVTGTVTGSATSGLFSTAAV